MVMQFSDNIFTHHIHNNSIKQHFIFMENQYTYIIYILYIYIVAVLLHIESRCRLDLRNNSLHHFIIHRNLRLNSSKSNES